MSRVNRTATDTKCVIVVCPLFSRSRATRRRKAVPKQGRGRRKIAVVLNLHRSRKTQRIRAERKAGQMMAGMERGKGGDRKSGQRVQRGPSDFAKAKQTANISDTAPLWFALAGFGLPGVWMAKVGNQPKNCQLILQIWYLEALPFFEIVYRSNSYIFSVHFLLNHPLNN